jgi:hypothetical protein
LDMKARGIKRLAIKPYRWIWHYLQRPWIKRDSGKLIVFYDWKASAAPSFHAVYFAGEVERLIRRNDYKSVTIISVPAENDRTSVKAHREKNNIPDADKHEWRLRNLVLPALSLLSVQPEIFVCRTRKQARTLLRTIPGDVVPKHYTLRLPDRIERGSVLMHRSSEEIRGLLQPSDSAGFYARSWLNDRLTSPNAISLTLRESTFATTRNTSRDEMLKIAVYLLDEGYSPFFIPDTESENIAELAQVAPVYEAATWNFELRAAAMQQSVLCVLGSNGPAVLPLYLPDCNFMAFGIVDQAGVTKEDGGFTLRWLMDHYGLNESLEGNWLGSGHQQIAEPINLELFKTHFKEFIKKGWVEAPV